MEYYYDFSYNPGLFGGLVITAYVVAAALVGLAGYIMESIGLQAIAKRRGLNHPWLAWIPVGRDWLIGSVSDQYQYLVKGENKSKRKLMLGLSIAKWACAVAAVVTAVILFDRLDFTRGFGSDKVLAAMLMGPVLAALVIGCVIGVVSVVKMVFHYICMYDLYRSCDPHNAVAYLVLGILFGILEPIFLIVVRKKDGGMPPRRDAYRSSQEPWENQ